MTTKVVSLKLQRHQIAWLLMMETCYEILRREGRARGPEVQLEHIYGIQPPDRDQTEHLRKNLVKALIAFEEYEPPDPDPTEPTQADLDEMSDDASREQRFYEDPGGGSPY